jgi:hypothetical protein
MVEGLLAKIRHPVLKRMVALWAEKRREAEQAGRPWPDRAAFDPLSFPFALGYISLVEVRPDPARAPGRTEGRRFFFRLDGSHQVDLFGVDCTGKFLDQAMSGDMVPMTERSYGAVVDSGQPSYHLREIEYRGRPLHYEIAILPLSRSGERVDMLMTVVTPDFGGATS